MRKPPKSKVLISVCKDLETGAIFTPCVNMSLSELDYIVDLLQEARLKFVAENNITNEEGE